MNSLFKNIDFRPKKRYIGFLTLGFLALLLVYYFLNNEALPNTLRRDLYLADYQDTIKNSQGFIHPLEPCKSVAKLKLIQNTWLLNNSQMTRARFWLSCRATCTAHQYKNKISEPPANQQYWGKLYQKLVRHDSPQMIKVYEKFAQIAKSQGLDAQGFATLIIQFAQSIPYVLIHPNACTLDSSTREFSKIYHQKGGICLPNCRFGLQSPMEFMYNQRGDCDTKVLFVYTILQYFGYDVLILGSPRHTILALNLPAQGRYFWHKGKKYYFWETAAENYQLGMLPLDYQQEKWEVNLESRK